MKVLNFGPVRYFLTGNRPYYVMELFIRNSRLPFEERKRIFRGNGEIFIHVDSLMLSRKLVEFLGEKGYDRFYTDTGNPTGKRVDPVQPQSPHKIFFNEPTEIQVTLKSRQTIKKFVEAILEFNRNNEVKLIYRYTPDRLIIA